MEDQSEAKRFSLVKRAKSFTYAGRGVWIMLKTTHNAWVHLGIFAISIIMGLYYRISNVDWILLVCAAGIVLAAEAFNTAIEIDIDLTSPAYHPYARDTKDVAAGAVLITAVAAAIIGALIFAPYILASTTL